MNKIRFGVIGCGGMGQNHIKWINELECAKLAAVCDCDEVLVKNISNQYKVKGFNNYKDLIESGLVDAILIVTPHYLHPIIGIDAFRKGIHVLSEKPITVTVSEADKFLNAAKKSGKVFGVMYQSRTLPAIRVAREIIESGKLGEIRRTLMIDTMYRSQAYYDSAYWRGTWIDEGGGVLVNQAPHGIDLFILLGGLPKYITAKIRTRLHKIEVEDEAEVFLEYKNGVHGYYYTTTCELPTTTRIEICGDKGKLIYNNGELKLWTFTPSISEHNKTNTEMWASPDVKEECLQLPQVQTGHKEIIRNFCAHILTGEPLISPGEHGLWTVEFFNAVILSSKTNRTVEIPVDRKEYDKLLENLKKGSKKKQINRDKHISDPKFK